MQLLHDEASALCKETAPGGNAAESAHKGAPAVVELNAASAHEGATAAAATGESEHHDVSAVAVNAESACEGAVVGVAGAESSDAVPGSRPGVNESSGAEHENSSKGKQKLKRALVFVAEGVTASRSEINNIILQACIAQMEHTPQSRKLLVSALHIGFNTLLSTASLHVGPMHFSWFAKGSGNKQPGWEHSRSSVTRPAAVLAQFFSSLDQKCQLDFISSFFAFV